MNVSACLVTKGNVDLAPVLDSLPAEWERVIWDNGLGVVDAFYPQTKEQDRIMGKRGTKGPPGGEREVPDLSVYGRYAAIALATHDLIYVQDDDVIVSDPEALVKAWVGSRNQCAEEQFDPALLWKVSTDEIKVIARGEHVCCNMPSEFRPHYPDAALVGFGAAFHRDAPARAFDRFVAKHGYGWRDMPEFLRECDRVFTVLTPRVLVDVPKQDREFASDDDRLWKQPEHFGATKRMLDLARQVRDA